MKGNLHFEFAELRALAYSSPATVRFLLVVRSVGWVTLTIGKCLQRLRQLKLSLGWLGSSTKLSYRPTDSFKRKIAIYTFR